MNEEKEKITRKQILIMISQYAGQENIITVPRFFVNILGSLSHAVFLNQLLYWQDKMKGDWLFKTYQEWKEEIGISAYEIRKVTKKFIELGFLETQIKKAKGNPTVHYRLKSEEFLNWLIKILTNESEKFNKQKLNFSLSYNKESFTKVKDKVILEKTPKSHSFKSNIFLEKWNSLKEKYPMLRQHKNPSTKTYQNTVKMFKHLQKGTFENFVSIDPKFMKRNHIPYSLLRKKWNNQEINECLDRLPKLFLKGYWPYDKSKLPRDLNTLIYHPRTNTSFFLLVKQCPPRRNSEEKTDEQIYNEIKNKNTGTWTEEQLQEHLNSIDIEWYEEAKKEKNKRRGYLS